MRVGVGREMAGTSWLRRGRADGRGEDLNETRRVVGGRWALGDRLGRGSFASVWRAVDLQTNAVVAVKEIACERLSSKLKESLRLEVEVLRRTRDGNILRFIDMHSTKDTVFIVLEYCAGGDLSQFIKRRGRIDEASARRFMLQLASGLHSMRRSQLIHRDLKPQNLLLTADDLNGELKIADFGFARYIRDSEGMADTVCGSPLYMAPEVLNYQKYDAKADLWSTGAILFEMLVGQVPFTGQNQVQLLRNIQTTEFKIPGHIANDLSPECIDLLRGLLRRDADNRISFDEFFNHPFFKLDIGVQIPRQTNVKSERHAARSGCSDDSETMTFDMDEEGASPPTQQIISAVNQAQTRPVVSIPKHRSNSDADEINLGADYVLVSSPGAMMRNRSMAIRAPSLGSSPLSRMSPSPSDGGSSPLSGPARVSRGASPIIHGRGQQTHSQVLAAHLGVRVGVLEKDAAVLRDTSIEQWNSGNKLEALSLGLVSLAALRSAYRLAGEILSSELKASVGSAASLSSSPMSSSPSGSSFSMATSAKRAMARIKEAFAGAHLRADKAATACRASGIDTVTELPDGMELVYQKILRLGKEGVCEEVAERKSTACEIYGRAQTLLQFLIGEGPTLHITPALVIDASTHARLSQIAATLASRQNALQNANRANGGNGE